MTRIVRSLGLPLENIFPARSEAEALTAFTNQHQLGRPIHIILTDLNMGEGGNGFSLAHKVREFERAASPTLHTTIFIVSGSSCKEERGFELVEGELLKPINKEDLAMQLTRVNTSLLERPAYSGAGAGSRDEAKEGDVVKFRV